MKLMKYFLLLTALALLYPGCGSKENSNTNTNTNSTNTGNISTNQQPGSNSPADTLKKFLSQEVKTDSIVQKKTADTVSPKINFDPLPKIASFLKEQFKDEYKKLSAEDRKFSVDSYDLTGDGRNEYFVVLNGSHFCGTGGCTMFILNADFTYNTKMLVVQTPLYVSLTNMTNKWRDLYVKSGKGYHKLVFSTTQYPSNPSMEPDFDLSADTHKTEILSDKNVKRSSF